MTAAELPVRVPLAVPQGITFRRRFHWALDGVAVDLTGWDAHMQVRRFPSAGTVLADLTPGAGITLGADGYIDVMLTAGQTAELPVTKGVYDLRLTQPGGGDTIGFLTGPFTVTPAVTRVVTSP